MHPILFELAGYEVASYGVALVVAFAVGIAVARRRAQARGLDAGQVDDVALVIILTALIGARGLWVLTHLERFDAANDWLGALNPFGGSRAGASIGLSMHGGVALALVAAFAFFRLRRLPFLRYADAMAPSLLLGEGITRIGCFLNGCCHGLACSYPWAVHFPPGAPASRLLGEVGVHPTQLYASVLGFAGFALLVWLAREPSGLPGGLRRRLPHGVVFASSLLLIAGFRIALDFVRFQDPETVLWHSGGLLVTVNQLLCIGLLAIACSVLWVRLGRRGAAKEPQPATTSAD